MSTSLRLTPARSAALALLGAVGLFYVLAVTQLQPVATVIGVALVALGLVAANTTANAVADRLDSERLPWALYAAVTSVGVVGIVALVEIGSIFAASDRGEVTAIPTAVLVATGVAGVTAALSVVALGLAVVVRLAKPTTADATAA
jgi:uncharacterized membrane protein